MALGSAPGAYFAIATGRLWLKSVSAKVRKVAPPKFKEKTKIAMATEIWACGIRFWTATKGYIEGHGLAKLLSQGEKENITIAAALPRPAPAKIWNPTRFAVLYVGVSIVSSPYPMLANAVPPTTHGR
jgi:hypothetical protein